MTFNKYFISNTIPAVSEVWDITSAQNVPRTPFISGNKCHLVAIRTINTLKTQKISDMLLLVMFTLRHSNLYLSKQYWIGMYRLIQICHEIYRITEFSREFNFSQVAKWQRPSIWYQYLHAMSLHVMSGVNHVWFCEHALLARVTAFTLVLECCQQRSTDNRFYRHFSIFS